MDVLLIRKTTVGVFFKEVSLLKKVQVMSWSESRYGYVTWKMFEMEFKF